MLNRLRKSIVSKSSSVARTVRTYANRPGEWASRVTKYMTLIKQLNPNHELHIDRSNVAIITDIINSLIWITANSPLIIEFLAEKVAQPLRPWKDIILTAKDIVHGLDDADSEKIYKLYQPEKNTTKNSTVFNYLKSIWRGQTRGRTSPRTESPTPNPDVKLDPETKRKLLSLLQVLKLLLESMANVDPVPHYIGLPQAQTKCIPQEFIQQTQDLNACLAKQTLKPSPLIKYYKLGVDILDELIERGSKPFFIKAKDKYYTYVWNTEDRKWNTTVQVDVPSGFVEKNDSNVNFKAIIFVIALFHKVKDILKRHVEQQQQQQGGKRHTRSRFIYPPRRRETRRIR